MDDQYGGGYDPQHDCWSFSHLTDQGESLDYCMRPGTGRLINTAKGTQLYLYAANAYDIADDSRYIYSHNRPGLLGAFKLQLDSKGGWTYLAMDNAMAFGTAGYCGCNQPRFVKLSDRDDYGWLFASGGVWQGTVVSDYSIVVARGTGFVDVSRIPQIRESAQDVSYDVAVADHPANGWFSLLVTKTGPRGQTDHIPVDFDYRKFVYELPEGR